MDTKGKILKAAVRLYNKDGLSNVTSRHIAAALKISHGNLEYHFPNKESLLIAIYQRMSDDMSRYYPEHKEDILNPIEHLHRLLVRLEDFQTEYKFFCMDLIDTCRKYEKVNQLLVNNMQIRKGQMVKFFEKFLELGYMKNESTAGYYERLQHTIRILLTFWKPQEIVVANSDFNVKGEMVRHIWDLLLPHFTEKGRTALENVLKKFTKPSSGK
ncbi:MAG: TetR family transcriptional regulator [Cyclobacteriaceae bacterium]